MITKHQRKEHAFKVTFFTVSGTTLNKKCRLSCDMYRDSLYFLYDNRADGIPKDKVLTRICEVLFRSTKNLVDGEDIICLTRSLLGTASDQQLQQAVNRIVNEMELLTVSSQGHAVCRIATDATLTEKELILELDSAFPKKEIGQFETFNKEVWIESSGIEEEPEKIKELWADIQYKEYIRGGKLAPGTAVARPWMGMRLK